MKSMDSADSDDDFVAEVDDEQSDELDSLVADASEEDSSYEEDEEEEEEDEEEWTRIVKPRVQKLGSRSRKSRVKREEYDDDVDEGEEKWENGVKSRAQKGNTRTRKNMQSREVGVEDEGGWRTVVKPSFQKGSARSSKNGLKTPKKRRKIASPDSGDSDDNDEEFTLDDVDSFEEDDNVSFLRLNKRRGNTPLNGGSSVKSRRGKRSAEAIQKPLKRKTEKSRSLKRKAKCVNDEGDADIRPALRTRRKKKPVRRNKRVAGGTDSDSSDYEFTISEEEREQVSSVASGISRSLKTNSRSSRKIDEDEPFCKKRKPPLKKGKEKVQETANDAGDSVCGICLTEEGKKTIRGTLNCCNHYFCFACIMEWSKVESRCPICKQRFVTISKPARCVKGFDVRNTVIQVPERDQVYQPAEEDLREFLNPYDNAMCTECHQGGDDALMLLCDVCDSPAHTYCVGLGREVPEGNWYCDTCRPAALGLLHSQTQAVTPDRAANSFENMAEIDLNVTIPETPISQQNGLLSSPRYSGGGVQSSSPLPGVSTVSGRRRRIQSRIWNMLSERATQAPQEDLSSQHHPSGRVNPTFEQSQTDAQASYIAHHVDRLHGISSHNQQNRDLFLQRMGQMVGHGDQASTSTNGSVETHRQLNQIDSMNLRGSIRTPISSGEQLCHGSTGSSSSPGFAAFPSRSRDGGHANSARQQVHSVVRFELKSLSREINLGHDAYAEISRRSVDTVMAACGLEPRRSDVFETQLPNCIHLDELGYVENRPMNACCSICFQSFVKDVVRRIMDITIGPHRLLLRH